MKRIELSRVVQERARLLFIHENTLRSLQLIETLFLRLARAHLHFGSLNLSAGMYLTYSTRH